MLKEDTNEDREKRAGYKGKSRKGKYQEGRYSRREGRVGMGKSHEGKKSARKNVKEGKKVMARKLRKGIH